MGLSGRELNIAVRDGLREVGCGWSWRVGDSVAALAKFQIELEFCYSDTKYNNLLQRRPHDDFRL